MQIMTARDTNKNNLDKFQESGYLSLRQREDIQPILEVGHAAIHRGYHPNEDDVLTVVEVTESLVETVYIHPTKTSKLGKRVPKREK